MPPAVQTNGGDRATYNAAVALVRGFALADAEALALLQDWNKTHCDPPWKEAGLRQKLLSARKSALPLGHLKDDPKFKASSADARLTNHGLSAEKRRARWPKFQPLAETALRRIADQRHLPLRAVETAHDIGCLAGAVVDGQRCYLLHEGTFAQARRLDGELFEKADGGTLKAKNLPGSEGAFIGLSTLVDPDDRVLLVEGVIGLLEGLAACHLLAPAQGWAVLAATSASSRFSRDPALLARLQGRRVRIVPDADDSGLDAACIWLDELEKAGARVDLAPELPPGCKDLGPIVSVSSITIHSNYITELFQ